MELKLHHPPIPLPTISTSPPCTRPVSHFIGTAMTTDSNNPVHHTIHVRPPPCNFLAGACFCTHPSSSVPKTMPSQIATSDSSGASAVGCSAQDTTALRPPGRPRMRPTRGAQWHRDRQRKRQRLSQATLDGWVVGGDQPASAEGALVADTEAKVAMEAPLKSKFAGIMRPRVRRGMGEQRGMHRVAREKEARDQDFEKSLAERRVDIANINTGGYLVHKHILENEGLQGRGKASELGHIEEIPMSPDDSINSSADCEGHSTSGGYFESRFISPTPPPGINDASIFDIPANYILPSGTIPTTKERAQARGHKMLEMIRFLKVRKAALLSAE
ncbi:hypothetical protein DFP73DRAFT_528118 [Morchella snyderi]|nr:hypothetical protein DFP73DRAFT_528118 [Morchella snyderi]